MLLSGYIRDEGFGFFTELIRLDSPHGGVFLSLH